MWGTLAAVGGSLLSGYLNNQAAASRQDDAQGFSAQQFASRYQTTVKDMQAAGLNPMLAYTQGGGNAPTSSAASSAGYGDLGQTMTQAKMASAQVANLAADTENKKAQAGLIEAQIAQTRASAGQLVSSTAVQDETVNKIKQEVVNLGTENDKAKAIINNLRIEYENLVKQGYNLTEIGNQIRGTISKLSAETTLLGDKSLLTRTQEILANLDVSAAQSLGNVGREFGQLKPIIDVILKALMGARR
jgi:hypothetical protein